MGYYRVKWKIILKVCRSLRAGSTLFAACKGAGVDASTIWHWRGKYPKLNNILEDIYQSRTQLVEDALFANCMKGVFTAQQYFLNNRAHVRWARNPETPIVYQDNRKIIFESKPMMIFAAVPENQSLPAPVPVKDVVDAVISEQASGDTGT